jgi:hypothetical protein
MHLKKSKSSHMLDKNTLLHCEFCPGVSFEPQGAVKELTDFNGLDHPATKYNRVLAEPVRSKGYGPPREAANLNEYC